MRQKFIIASLLFMFLFGSVNASDSMILESDVVCLTNTIYFEARGESFLGKLAVGSVVRNRMIRQGKTACEIVYEKNQFSWTRTIPVVTNQKVWLSLYQLSIKILLNEYPDPTNGAVFFHEKTIEPFWKDSLVKSFEEGNHIFYRFPYPYNSL